MEPSEYQRVIRYLKHDVTKNLPTLKYLSGYPDSSITSLLEDDTGWAVSVELPVSCIAYDTKTYPLADKVVFLNGTSQLLKYRLLSALTPRRYVLKLNEDLDLSLMNQQYQIAKGNSFLSFSSSVIPDSGTLACIDGKRESNEEIIRLIMKNGYEESDVRNYFDQGALWFGLTRDNEMQSVCFIFQNYESVWEIAGVRTIETERHKGHARAVVASALRYILGNNLVPRYVVNVQNSASIHLAQGLNMMQALRLDHFLLYPKVRM